MNCPYCSAIIADDVRFCPKCGTEMGSPLPDSPAYRGPLPAGFDPPTSGKAIGSLMSGFFFLFLPASIVAVVLGHLSLSEIRKSAGRMKGQGIATAGLVLGYIGIAVVPFIILGPPTNPRPSAPCVPTHARSGVIRLPARSLAFPPRSPVSVKALRAAVVTLATWTTDSPTGSHSLGICLPLHGRCT